MRRGHRRRLIRDEERESCRGRATYARSLNKGRRRHASNRGGRFRERRKEGRWQHYDLEILFSVDAFGFEQDAFEFEEESGSVFDFDLAHDEGTCGQDQSTRAACTETATETADFLWATVHANAANEATHRSMQSNSNSSDDWSLCSSGDDAPLPRRRHSALAWEAAQKRAEDVAKAYLQSHHNKRSESAQSRRRRRQLQPALPPSIPVTVHHPQWIPREEQQGSHAPQFEHQQGLALAAAKQAAAACAPKLKTPTNFQVEVAEGSAEYCAVIDYFQSTVLRSDEIVGLSRLQNATVYRRFASNHSDEELSVMFHGCGSPSNEESIMRHGFQVSHCRSGGQNFGTWFAYNAKYSDAGYTFRDEKGVDHIFVCLVSRRCVVVDNMTMRVVAQDCAYPLWLLRYRRSPDAIRSARTRPRQGPAFFFVVKDGKWLREDRI